MKRTLIFIVTIACAICLASCNGRTAKITEKAAKELWKEGKYKILHPKPGPNTSSTIGKIRDLGEDLLTQKCSRCGGYGYVYRLNEFGYNYVDYYGQPLVFPCPDCNTNRNCTACSGSGYVYYNNGYGYPVVDAYGYPLIFPCPYCGNN